MKNKLNTIVGTACLLAASAVPAMAVGLDTTAAETAITDATGKASTVVVAGFAIGAVFLVAKVIRRGMRSAG